MGIGGSGGCNSILRNDAFAAAGDAAYGHAQLRKSQSNPSGYSRRRQSHRSIRHKARLGAKSYMQPDWGKTYAPVGNLTTFRYLASLSAGYGLEIDHLDMQPDWGETYASVGNLAKFRYLASLAAGYGVAIDRSDFVTASSTPMATI